MRDTANSNNTKVFYTPIEAAIRWSNLSEYENHILSKLDKTSRPPGHKLTQWPLLRLNIDRIYDGLLNDELPFGREGITCDDRDLLSSPYVTIRHVHLRIWMIEYYPDQRPDFLFDEYERAIHPSITVETVQAMALESNLWRSTSLACHSSHEKLRTEHEALLIAHAELTARDPDALISQRAETTYLNVIGALIQLMLSDTPAGVPYSTFRSQEAIITALIAHHTGLMGITERTLHAKFAEAKRRLVAQIS